MAREYRLRASQEFLIAAIELTRRWRESGGAGLGLSIAKGAIEVHGGCVSLESLLNKGALSG